MKPSYRLITTIVLGGALLATLSLLAQPLSPDELLRSALELARAVDTYRAHTPTYSRSFSY